jgi:hypothetical protein
LLPVGKPLQLLLQRLQALVLPAPASSPRPRGRSPTPHPSPYGAPHSAGRLSDQACLHRVLAGQLDAIRVGDVTCRKPTPSVRLATRNLMHRARAGIVGVALFRRRGGPSSVGHAAIPPHTERGEYPTHFVSITEAERDCERIYPRQVPRSGTGVDRSEYPPLTG